MIRHTTLHALHVFQLHVHHSLSCVPLRQYRACVIDSLGLGITCVLYLSTRHPDLVSCAFYAIPIFHIIILRIFNLLVICSIVHVCMQGVESLYMYEDKVYTGTNTVLTRH